MSENVAPAALKPQQRAFVPIVSRHRSGAQAGAPALVLLLSLAACSGSPAMDALEPGFDATTPAQVPTFSTCQKPPGMTEFAEGARSSLDQAAPASAITGAVHPPSPQRQIVWHVDSTASRGTPGAVVNAPKRSTPCAHGGGASVQRDRITLTRFKAPDREGEGHTHSTRVTSQADYTPGPETIGRGTEP